MFMTFDSVRLSHPFGKIQVAQRHGPLDAQLSRGRRYRAVKAIPWLLEEFMPSKGMYSVVGKTLRRISADLGYSVEKIATPEFPDGVNAYHVDVIAAFRNELDRNPGMLDRYRRRDAA